MRELGWMLLSGLLAVTFTPAILAAEPDAPVGETTAADAPLMLTLTDDTFEQEVLKSRQPVLVFFSAQWAGPGRIMSPAIEELAKEHADKLRVGRVEVDDCIPTCKKYKIDKIPAVVIFREGVEEGRQVGLVAKEKLDALLVESLGEEFSLRQKNEQK